MKDMDKRENVFAKEIIPVCKKCKTNMTYKGSGCYLCESCGEEYLTDFGKVKRFISTHGPSNAITIAKETGVSRNIIQELLREGRVEVVESASSDFAFCLSCGVPIRSGKYCHICLERMANEASAKGKGTYNALAGDVMNDQKGQMRFKNRIDQ